MDNIIVGIAEGKTAVPGQMLTSYALGSCVGVCLYDREHRIAGLVHVILPEKSAAVNRENPYKFGDEGVRRLIQEMEQLGAVKERLTAKIAGGAKMFMAGRPEWEIGALNVASVKKTLAEEGISLIAEDTGKDYGRTVCFFAGDGRLEVRTVRHETIVL